MHRLSPVLRKDLVFSGVFSFVDSKRETVVNYQRNTVRPTVQPHTKKPYFRVGLFVNQNTGGHVSQDYDAKLASIINVKMAILETLAQSAELYAEAAERAAAQHMVEAAALDVLASLTLVNTMAGMIKSIGVSENEIADFHGELAAIYSESASVLRNRISSLRMAKLNVNLYLSYPPPDRGNLDLKSPGSSEYGKVTDTKEMEAYVEPPPE